MEEALAPKTRLAEWPIEGRVWHLSCSEDRSSSWRAVLGDQHHLPCLGSDRPETRKGGRLRSRLTDRELYSSRLTHWS